jgi:uncharacterized cupredoxin-like copper-binding protein
MNETYYPLFATLVGLTLLALVGGCSASTVQYAVPGGAGDKTVAIEATSFEFSPNRITAPAGSKLLLSVKNRAGMDHNLTLEDATNHRLLELALPAGETVIGDLGVLPKGEYTFHCNKPLHTTFGMQGTLVIE